MARKTTLPAQLSALYQDAVENLRFLKQQQWRVTNYALLIFVSVYILHRNEGLF